MEFDAQTMAVVRALGWAQVLPFEVLQTVRQPIQTEWIVITGTISAGKSTILNALTASNVETVNELPMQLLETAKRDFGIEPEEIFANHQAIFQDCIVAHGLERHAALDPNRALVLDRALPDPIAFNRALGYSGTEEMMRLGTLFRYRGVILLEPAPLENHAFRPHGQSFTDRLHDQIGDVYAQLGYSPIRIPMVPTKEEIPERVEAVRRAIATLRST